jgi:hypothetical protein
MQKYEYKVSDVLKQEELESYMNDMAKEGWRVIDTVFWEKFKIGIVVTLEREMKQ